MWPSSQTTGHPQAGAYSRSGRRRAHSSSVSRRSAIRHAAACHWRLDEEGGGIDCTATDGAGAGLFATGTMDFTLTRRFTDSIVSGDTRLAGTVTDTSGGRWLSDVRYKVKNTGGHDLYVQPNIRLVPLG